ncbi:MAG: kojibiose phosphorylase, partial [Frondihabitans sp.]|nr:kojibiose phosphorylase [Frondihabitans sp.]
KLALSYFYSSLFVDLADLHNNTSDGVHVASTGGIWSALVNGFGGMRDHDGRITFNPRLPEGWEKLTFRMTLGGSRMRINVEQHSITFTIEEGDETVVHVNHERYEVTKAAPVVVPLTDQGPRIDTPPPTTSDLRGMLRADGSVVTASIPTISIDRSDIDIDVTS